VSRQFIIGKDDSGKLAGSGPLKGTFPWRKVSGTVTVPEQAERFEVFFGLRPCKGRARFADIDLQTEAGTEAPAGEARPMVEAMDMEQAVKEFVRQQGELQRER
jgi:hypothetical protein